MKEYPPHKVPLQVQDPLTPVEGSLSFDSHFESGNLRKAIRASEVDYNLFLEFDVETTGHTQWFYFSVENHQCVKAVRFNIMNFMKSHSLYTVGLKPAVYSHEKGWHRDGTNISYYKNTIPRPSGEGSYYTLSFTYTFTKAHSKVYFAHCYPYTYSDLLAYLSAAFNRPEVSLYCRKDILCTTLAGNDCPLLTITENVASLSWEEELAKLHQSTAARRLQRLRYAKAAKKLKRTVDLHSNKKVVILMGRVHAGESNSSFMLQGALEFLLGNSPQAAVLRKQYIFKVIPMMNPDGVVYGNYRCSLLGVDLNRRWKKPVAALHPTIYFAKKLVQVLSEEFEIALCCDFHGHSAKTEAFFYGCTSESIDSVRQNCFIKLIPYYMAKANPHCSFEKSHFRMEKSKEATARIVLFKEFKILNSFTLEASFYGAGERHFTVTDLQKIGQTLMNQLQMLCTPGLFRKRLNAMVKSLAAKQPDNKQEETDLSETPQVFQLVSALELIDQKEAAEIPASDTESAGSDSCPSDNDDRKIEFLHAHPPKLNKNKHRKKHKELAPVEVRAQSTPKIIGPKVYSTQEPVKIVKKREVKVRARSKWTERKVSTPNYTCSKAEATLPSPAFFEPSSSTLNSQCLIISASTRKSSNNFTRLSTRGSQETMRKRAIWRRSRLKHPQFLVTNAHRLLI